MADIAARELLEDQDRVEAPEAGAAMLFLGIDPAKAELGQFLENRPVEIVLLLPFAGIGLETVIRKGARGLDDHFLFGCQHGIPP